MFIAEEREKGIISVGKKQKQVRFQSGLATQLHPGRMPIFSASALCHSGSLLLRLIVVKFQILRKTILTHFLEQKWISSRAALHWHYAAETVFYIDESVKMVFIHFASP